MYTARQTFGDAEESQSGCIGLWGALVKFVRAEDASRRIMFRGTSKCLQLHLPPSEQVDATIRCDDDSRIYFDKLRLPFVNVFFLRYLLW